MRVEPAAWLGTNMSLAIRRRAPSHVPLGTTVLAWLMRSTLGLGASALGRQRPSPWIAPTGAHPWLKNCRKIVTKT
jgi:hypothetical protein